MGKKRKAPEPGDDGYLRTGIYKRYVGPRSHQSIREVLSTMKKMAEEPDLPISEWLENIRTYLTGFILPYAEEVLPDDPKPGAIYAEDLGKGRQVFRISDSLVEGTPEYEAAMDAIQALRDVHMLATGMTDDETPIRSLRYLIDSTFKLGRTMERILIRPYEPLVATEISRRTKRGKKRKNEGRLTDAQWKLVKAFIQKRVDAGSSASKACDEVSAKLLTGTFPRLQGKTIDLSTKSLQNKWSRRNK